MHSIYVAPSPPPPFQIAKLMSVGEVNRGAKQVRPSRAGRRWVRARPRSRCCPPPHAPHSPIVILSCHQYVFSYTVEKVGEPLRTVYQSVAMGNNGR